MSSISKQLTSVAKLCKAGAKRITAEMLELGPKPTGPSAALLWEQQIIRLQGHFNSLIAMVPKLTALSIIEGLKEFEDELEILDTVSKEAQKNIRKIKELSDVLEKSAQILGLGLSVLSAATTPSSATVGAVLTAAQNVASD